MSMRVEASTKTEALKEINPVHSFVFTLRAYLLPVHMFL